MTTYLLESALDSTDHLPDSSVFDHLLEILERTDHPSPRALAARLADSVIAHREHERTVAARLADSSLIPVSAPVITRGGEAVAVVSSVPDTFTRRAHTVVTRRSNSGRTNHRVTRFGRASIAGGVLRVTADGAPITDGAMLELCDAIEALEPLLDGTYDARDLERLADHYLGDVVAPVEHGTDIHEWHQMTGPESGIVATDWNTLHRNPTDCHAAAVARGLIEPHQYPMVRDGARPVGAPPARRLERMPSRYTLPVGRPRHNDPTDRRRADGTLEIVAPTESTDHRFVGFVRVPRGMTRRDEAEYMARRSVIQSRSRVDRRDMVTLTLEQTRAAIVALEPGDRMTGIVNSHRARVSRRADGRYCVAVWGNDGRRFRADNIPTADRAVARLEQMTR